MLRKLVHSSNQYKTIDVIFVETYQFGLCNVALSDWIWHCPSTCIPDQTQTLGEELLCTHINKDLFGNSSLWNVMMGFYFHPAITLIE